MIRIPNLGIAGGSGSGKTTLARLLIERLEQWMDPLSFGWYYRNFTHLSQGERNHVNWDEPAVLEDGLLARHLEQLRQGRTINTPRYNFAQHARMPETVPYSPGRVVVSEGILLFAFPRLLGHIDIKIFVDAPEDIRLARRIERDRRERGRTEASVRTQWRETVQPMFERHVAPTRNLADYIIDGTQPFDAFAAFIEQRVGELLDAT